MSMFWVSVVTLSIGADIAKHSAESAARQTEKIGAANALEKRKAASQEIEVASANARRKQHENQQILARIHASNASSGFQMSGSPLAIFGESSRRLEQDILDIDFEAKARRRALLAGANLDVFESQSQAAGMRNEATASGIGSAGGGVISGASAKGYFT